MIYPEIPKSKRKSSYIVGGIFAIFAGTILLLLFLPKFTDKVLGFILWDWSTILPQITPDFFLSVGSYMQIGIPVVLFLCVVASFFMGISKSSMFLKISMACSTFAYLLSYSLSPANLSNTIVGALKYVAYVLLGISLVFVVLGIIFRFRKDEVYVPYHANSFHIFCSIALLIISALDIFSDLLKFDGISANSRYYYCAVIAIFLITAGIWMLCSSKRSPNEFGTGYERDSKIKAEQKQDKINQTQGANELNAQNVNAQTTPLNMNAGLNQMPQQGAQIPPQTQNELKPQNAGGPQQTEPQVNATQTVLSDGRGVQTPQQMSPQNPNLQVVGNGSVPPRPAMPPRLGPDGKPMPPFPPRPANMPPRLGPDGKPLPPFPPRPANMPPKLGPDGKPLPPFPPRPANMPPRPANMPPQNPNVAQPEQQNTTQNTPENNQNNIDKGE
ncbi:MAG: hypothetical protein IJ837_02555 [Clostridia bacterium]|nr:hypothetical protein [Clostridia bacterium]